MRKNLVLAIDAGNTNVVFAIFDGNSLIKKWRTSTEVKRTVDEYGVWLDHLISLSGINVNDIGGAIVATVVPQITSPLVQLCENYFTCKPLLIDNGVAVGIEVEIPNREEIGADRLVNAVAATTLYPGNLIIIDFGTATTFDVVRGNGAYVGGVIAPGVNLSLEALEKAAARLPRISVAKPPSIIGDSTISAMQSGVYWGYISLIEGIVIRIKEELGTNLSTIATGGLASLFKNGTNFIENIEPDLTLIGLRIVYENCRDEKNDI